MADQARRKARHRLKRQQKKAQQRRAQASSPYKRIGTSGPVEACYINSDWREQGLAMIYLVRHNPAGGLALATYLVDLWCCGLKDAYGWLDLAAPEYEEYLQRVRAQRPLARIDPDVARKLVVGSVRFAQRNGFRLPPHYERWLALLGAPPQLTDADMAQFGKDGGLMYVGPLNDLRRRLIGCTAEEFLQREDVHFLMEPDDALLDEVESAAEDIDLDEQEVQECIAGLDAGASELATRIRHRMITRGQEPPERLDDAVELFVATSMLQQAEEELANEDEDVDDECFIACITAADTVLRALIGSPERPNIPPDLKEAVQQVAPILEELGTETLGGDASPDSGGSAPGP